MIVLLRPDACLINTTDAVQNRRMEPTAQVGRAAPRTDVPAERERHRVLGGISRARLLGELRRAGAPLGIRELAVTVGLHPNTVREHLDRLVAAGLVTRETSAPAGRGRPGLRYAAEPGGTEEDPSAYRMLARVLATALADRDDGVVAAMGAGERWGARAAGALGPVDDPAMATRSLVELLDDLGFAPEPDPAGGSSVLLHQCPFGALAHERGDVVCGVHLGLMRGALRELGAPLDAVVLEPFVAPGLCRARLEAQVG